MANKPLISLLYTEPLENGQWDTITEIPLDARITSSYSFTTQITRLPVEAGAQINDHAQDDPDKISLEGVVSDSPIVHLSTASPRLKGDSGSTQVRPGPRCQEAWDTIRKLQSEHRPLTVVTELQTFEDMLITSFEPTRSKDKGGDSLWFTMSLEKVVTVSTLMGSLPPDVVARLKRRRAKSKAKGDPWLVKLRAQLCDLVVKGRITKQKAEGEYAAAASAIASRDMGSRQRVQARYAGVR